MGLLDLILPVACVGCGRPGGALCAPCLASLAPAGAVPTPSGLDSCVALLRYEGLARQAISSIKYQNRRSILGVLACPAAQLVDPTTVDVVTWAPTVPTHRRERGFDHAELLARAVARALSRPTRALLRRSDGVGQTGRAASFRREPTPFVARRAVPRSVLLVDDVVTTGATLTAAAGELRRGGAAVVHGLALARTPHPGSSRTTQMTPV